jgi:hypothetical protein
MDKSLEDERGMKPFPRSVTAAFFSFILFGLSSFILSKKKKKKNNIHFHELPFTTGLFYFPPPPTLLLKCCLLPLFENGV